MAGRIAYYGGIVRDGLILNLDAAKRDSYPGSGTVWRDIVGTNNGTLTNGPTFSSANGGSIVFDGVDDNTSFSGNTLNYSPGTSGEISLEIWVYPTGPYTSYTEGSTTNLGGIFGQGYFGSSIGWGIGIFTASGINSFSFQVRNGGTISNATSSFTNNNWYNVAGTFTRNENTRLYINGVLTSTVSNTNIGSLTITPSINNASIGRTTPYHSGCRVSTARIYNRSLSATEVAQNYNATKTRFGL
jgi:hypothetical protein